MRTDILRNSYSLFLCFLFGAFFAASLHSQSSYEERELTSRNLILPETEQFRLASRLFQEKDKKLAAWKAYQTFLFNYPDSPLAADAQFMLAESIFSQAVKEFQSGNPPDELAWQRGKHTTQKIFKKGFHWLKKGASKVSGEPPPTEEPENINVATFSEAILQYRAVVEQFKRSGLADTAVFRIAECYYNVGDYPTALEHFKRVQKDFPQSYLAGESMLGAAQCYIPGGDFGTAELEIRKLVSTYPSYQEQPQVQFILGIIRFQEGKYEEALKALEKISTPEAVFYSGQALIQMGRALSAIAKFKRVIEEFKESPFAEQAGYLMGDAFFLSKNYTGAIQEYKKFLARNPQSPLKEGVIYKIAASHFLNKDYPTSRESFNLLLNTYPGGEFAPLSRYFIAESYRFAKQLKEASFSYGQLISAFPSVPITANARFKLGWVTYLQQNYSGATDAYQRFIDWNPFHAWVPHAYLLMGNCLLRLTRTEDAVNAYQQVFDRAPKTELAEAGMALLNRTRYQQGSYGQISSGFTYILKSLPPSESKWRAYSQLYLADSYYRQRLYREAISIYQSILALYPNHPVAIHAQEGLSWCHFQTGDYELAQREREKIKDIRLPEGVAAPTMTSGSYELANALFNQKKYMEALETYEKFINESPKSKDVPDAMFRIGLCYYRQEYYTQAISTWEDLERQHPKNPRTEEAVFQIADTYFRAQKYDKAVETYRKILAQYPKNPGILDATLRIGQSYYNGGEDEKAIPELDAFLRKYPDDPKAVETLDLLEASFDRLESAGGSAQKGINVLRGFVEAFPRTGLAAESQFRIARRQFNRKDYAKSVAEFEKMLLNYPDSSRLSEAQFYAAESYYILKKFTDAIAAFQKFLRNFSATEFSAAAWFHIGTSYFNTQAYPEAIEAYQNLIQNYPQSEFASAGYYNLALSQKKLQRLNDAADTYMKLALNYPQDPNANFAMLEVGKIYQELKQFGQAIMVLRDLELKIPAGDELKQEIAYLIGECYLANSDPEGALQSFKIVSSLPPQNSDWKLPAFQKMGEIYQKQERWSEAVSVYDEAARNSKDPKIAAQFRELAKHIKETYLGGKSGSPTPPAQKPKPQKTTTGG